MLTDLTQKQEGMTRPEKTIPLVMMYHPGETKVTALLQAQLEHHAVDEDDRAAKLLLEVEGTTKVVAYISRPNSRPRGAGRRGGQDRGTEDRGPFEF